MKPTRVGLGITALPSAGFSGSPPTPPAQTTPLPATQQQKQFRVPIKWGTRVYNATVTAPANLTAAQVAAAIAVQLDQIQDPNFKSGMPKLDLTFDGLAVTASLPGAAAGSPTYVVDQTKFPDVAKYTAAMQTGVVAPELAADQTFSRYQQEYSSAASRTAPAQPLSQSQRTAPASPVTHIGFQNVGNTCYVNAPLQAIAHNESLRSYLLKDGAIPDLSQQQVAANPHLKRLLDHYQIQAKQDGSYPHPLKLILAAYEYRLNPQSPQFGQPINPSVLIDYLRLLNKIDARGIQGDAHEAFSAIMAEVNPNLPGSPIAAQQRERAVRSDSVPSRPRTPDAMNFPLISLTPAGGTEGLPLQVQLDGYFHDESVAHDQASQYRRIHRGFTSAPELLGIYANRRTANGSKNTIPIQATERLSLAQSWVDGQPAPLPYDFDSMVYHNGLTGDRGHYVTIVREIDGAGVVTFKELSDSSPARIITDPAELAGMANTASLLFYQRPGAAPVNVPAHQSPRATTPPASRTGSGQHPSTSPRSQPRHASTSHRAPPSRKHRQGPMNPKLKQAYEGILSSERDPSADDDV